MSKSGVKYSSPKYCCNCIDSVKAILGCPGRQVLFPSDRQTWACCVPTPNSSSLLSSTSDGKGISTIDAKSLWLTLVIAVLLEITNATTDVLLCVTCSADSGNYSLIESSLIKLLVDGWMDGWMDDFLLQEAAPSGLLMRAKSYITKPVLAT